LVFGVSIIEEDTCFVLDGVLIRPRRDRSPPEGEVSDLENFRLLLCHSRQTLLSAMHM